LKRIAAVTVGRSDFGIFRPVFRAVEKHPDLQLVIIAAGAHLVPDFGGTIREIEQEGFEIAERVEMLLAGDSPGSIARSMGLGAIGFSRAYEHLNPDVLLLLGDRFEMHSAAVSAVPFNLPLAHIHGGEVTSGAIDDALRHSITKLSHLHFVSTEKYAARLAQMGEEEWRISVTGAPSLDNLSHIAWMNFAELSKQFGFSITEAPLIVTFHPTTLETDATAAQTQQLLSALGEFAVPCVFTLPNADTGGRAISRLVQNYCRTRQDAHLVENMGTRAYFSLMRLGLAMVGNSSSGIIEAPSFELPVVNIGSRQDGRIRGMNVIDVSPTAADIEAGIRKAIDPAFRLRLAQSTNPYGQGRAGERIAARLAEAPDRDVLIRKHFVDQRSYLPVASNSSY